VCCVVRRGVWGTSGPDKGGDRGNNREEEGMSQSDTLHISLTHKNKCSHPLSGSLFHAESSGVCFTRV